MTRQSDFDMLSQQIATSVLSIVQIALMVGCINRIIVLIFTERAVKFIFLIVEILLYL